MKPGFKPKTFQKKEWEDNRSPAVKGSGVGKALDVWNAKCPFDMKNITVNKIAEAFAAASVLDKALDVALRKCDPKAQKETIAGIRAYKLIIADYQKTLKATNVARQKREALQASLTFESVMADKELLAAFIPFTKKKALIYEVLHTFQLWELKKYEEAVKLYGKDNDYNVAKDINKILVEAYGGKNRGSGDLKALAAAIQTVPSQLKMMLKDARHYKGMTSSFGSYETFLALLDKRFPIVNFSL